MIIQHDKRRIVCLSSFFAMLMLAPDAKGLDTLFLDIPLGREQCSPLRDICIRYDALLSDSRCPIGLQCIRAGSADVRLLVNADTVKMNTFDSTSKLLKKTGYTIRLMEVHPYPIYAYPNYLDDHLRYLISRRDTAVEVALIKSPVQVNQGKSAPVLY